MASPLQRAQRPRTVKPSGAEQPATEQPWVAQESDWQALAQTRFMRGWQLAALSLGLRPNLGSLKQAPEALAAEYKVRRTAIRNAATPAAKKGKLQYEPDSIQSVIVIGKDKLTDLIFDAAKFLRFLKTTPAARVHVRFEEVVLQFQVGLSKKVPARNDNAAKSRIEGSLLLAPTEL